MSTTAPIDVFIAYSKKDQALLDRLVIQLRSVERIGLIDSWHDGEIQVGSDRETAILEAMHQAEIILLLISADFLASEFSYEKEIKVAQMLHEQKAAVMIPVILKDCAWKYTFPKQEVLPRNQIPINNAHWQNPDRAFKKEVVETVIQISEKLRNGEQVTSIQTNIKETTHREKTITVSKRVDSKPQQAKAESSSIWKYIAIGVVLLVLGWITLPMLTPPSNIGKTTKKETPNNRPSSTKTIQKESTSNTSSKQRSQLPFISIGQLDWMSQNLNRAMPRETWCPNEQEAGCARCGRYYTYESALRACPKGWRLPTRAEWKALDQSDLQKLKLKPCGFYNKATIQMGSVGNYWSSERSGGGEAWGLKFKNLANNRVDRLYTHFGASCRCVSENE